MSNTYVIAMIAVMSGVTILLRFLPFMIFGERKTPAYIDFLGKYLPYAIMGMLVVYCLKDISFLSGSHGIPELLCCLVTVGLHLWKRNALLSIGVSTVLYMMLVQLVF